MEDLLDDENLRVKIAQLEKDSLSPKDSSGRSNTVPAGVKRDFNANPGSRNSGRPSDNDPINERDTKLNSTRLPAVGSFGLIKDLVKDYTDLYAGQTKEKKKHELDSLRAFPAT